MIFSEPFVNGQNEVKTRILDHKEHNPENDYVIKNPKII